MPLKKISAEKKYFFWPLQSAQQKIRPDFFLIFSSKKIQIFFLTEKFLKAKKAIFPYVLPLKKIRPKNIFNIFAPQKANFPNICLWDFLPNFSFLRFLVIRPWKVLIERPSYAKMCLYRNQTILRRTLAWNRRFPFNPTMGGQKMLWCNALIEMMLYSIFNFRHAFFKSRQMRYLCFFVDLDSTSSLSLRQIPEKMTKLFSKS